jgi:tetratricopeptide (TPR) repeat protein
MCPYFRKSFLLTTALTLLLAGCGGARVKTSDLPQVQTGTANVPPSTPSDLEKSDANPRPSSGMPVANKFGERYDGNAEEDIANRVLKAWRAALAHDKRAGESDSDYKKQRAADEKESLAQLAAIEKDYPAQSTVLMMKGQVLEHFGKHEEAIKYYRQASQRNLVNSMAIFKAAEAERKTAHYDMAIEDYRKLIQVAPSFAPGHMGLARCLLAKNPKSPEAKKILNDALIHDPDSAEAKELLSKMQ